MYNYNRDVFNAEHERDNRMTTAAGRQVPYHLRVDNLKRGRSWLSGNIAQPAASFLSSLQNTVALHGGRYWRRSSSRLKGLIFNSVESIIPGKA